MATNRKQPFGYRIVCGEIVPHESEAATVQWIFATYLAGASYSTLVGALQERGVPYDTGKPWNKNIVGLKLQRQHCRLLRRNLQSGKKMYSINCWKR